MGYRGEFSFSRTNENPPYIYICALSSSLQSTVWRTYPEDLYWPAHTHTEPKTHTHTHTHMGSATRLCTKALQQKARLADARGPLHQQVIGLYTQVFEARAVTDNWSLSPGHRQGTGDPLTSPFAPDHFNGGCRRRAQPQLITKGLLE